MNEAFDGVIKFNPWLLIVDFILLILFLFNWYSQYKRTGVNIDIWIYNMLLIFVIPFLVMYPFAASDYNVLYVGVSSLSIIDNSINEAYIVTLVGFSSMFIGKLYFDRFGLNKIVNLFFYYPFISTIGLYYTKIVENKKISYGLSIIYIFILASFVGFTITQGFVNNPRAFFMANSQFRPFYNLITSLFSITFGIMATRILQYNKKFDKLLLLPIIIMGFFLGVRAPLIFQALGFGVLYVIYKKKGYVPLYKMVLFILAILILIIVLVLIRNSDVSTSRNTLNPALIFLLEIFYGNTFSDLRDFSWIIGYWDGIHLWGMSYISAFLSFIPSALLPFREKWGIGKITVNMLGFDPTIHPGLRPGFFGEMYLNFGICGVILLGFVWAQVIQKVNSVIKTSVTSNNVIAGSSAITASSFISNLSNSASFFGFYIFFITLFSLYLITKTKFNIYR